MKIGIIGAGITGLSAGYELAKQGHKVTIFERSAISGGLGAYIPIGNTHIERFYHHFFQSDNHILNYAKELAIDHKLKFYNSKTGIFINGNMYSFNSALDLIKYTPLPFWDRIRCAVTTGIFKFFPIPLRSLDKISAVEWTKTYAGTAVYKNLWGPLLKGKFSKFAENVPALWLWGRIHDRSFQLGYFDGSVKVLFDSLTKKIEDFQGELKFNAEITGIEAKNNKVYVLEKGEKFIFDKVIITTVSPIVEKLLKNKLTKSYKNLLQSVDHLGAVCLILELKQKIQPFYWINICENNAPVLVMIEHTNLISASEYGGKHLVYLANYIHRDDPRFALSDSEILHTYLSILPKINRNFRKSWIINSYISRVPRAQTIFSINAYKNLPPIQTEIKNVYTVSIDHMYPHDRNLNQGIKLGKKISAMIQQSRS